MKRLSTCYVYRTTCQAKVEIQLNPLDDTYLSLMQQSCQQGSDILVCLAVTVACAAAAISGSAYGHGISNAYSTPPNDYFEVRPYKPYSFSYKVKDPKTYNDFGHEEHSNGHSIHGSYHVALPDGRTQRVTYTADHNGYFPVIKYEGEARHPDPPKPAYPPAYSSPYSGYSSPYSGYPSATSSSSYSPPAYPSYSPAKSSYPSADTASYASTSSAYRGPANSLTSYGSSYPEEPPTYYPQSVSTAGSYKRDPPVSHSSGVNELPSYVISSSASPVSTPAPQTSAPSAASPAYRGLHYNAMPVYVIQSQVYQTPRYGTLQPHSTYNDDNNQLASSYYYPTTTSQTSEIPTLYYPLTAPAAQVHYPNCPLAKHYHVPY